jgi:hypothetical protein
MSGNLTDYIGSKQGSASESVQYATTAHRAAQLEAAHVRIMVVLIVGYTQMGRVPSLNYFGPVVHGSRKSPPFSCVSITVPDSLKTRISALCERLLGQSCKLSSDD